MPRPIRHHARSDQPAQRVFETLVDKGFLEARLADIGGVAAALLKHEAGGAPLDHAAYTLRQGVNRQDLPPVMQKVLPGNLVIERSETWRNVAPGRFSGTVAATVGGAPGKITGTLDLRDVAGGSELSMDGSVQVPLPFVGGKVETVIAEQVERLVGSETRYLQEWMAR
jgi:hypothetical protein